MRGDENDRPVEEGHVGSPFGQQQAAGLGVSQQVGPRAWAAGEKWSRVGGAGLQPVGPIVVSAALMVLVVVVAGWLGLVVASRILLLLLRGVALGMALLGLRALAAWIAAGGGSFSAHNGGSTSILLHGALDCRSYALGGSGPRGAL